MAQYWLLTVTEDNYHVIRRHRVYGAPASTRRDVTGLIRPGDVVIFYIAKKGSRALGGRLVAAYRVVGEWYAGEEPLWPDEREEGRVLYPYRVPLEWVVECIGAEAPAMRDLVPVLGFIAKKERWQAYLVGTPANAGRPLPPEDAEKILRVLRERCRGG